MDKPEKPVVALVRILNGTQHPALRFQVTLKPEQVREGYIRFGNTPGDELVGWWLLEDIVLAKVLGEPSADGKGWVST